MTKEERIIAKMKKFIKKNLPSDMYYLGDVYELLDHYLGYIEDPDLVETDFPGTVVYHKKTGKMEYCNILALDFVIPDIYKKEFLRMNSDLFVKKIQNNPRKQPSI